MNSWFLALIADLIKALFESALELVGSIGISVTVEDSPGVKGRLSEHLGLDFSVKFSSTPLDVKRVWSTTACCTHDQVASVILIALYRSWFL